jgi:hypothetical protein
MVIHNEGYMLLSLHLHVRRIFTWIFDSVFFMPALLSDYGKDNGWITGIRECPSCVNNAVRSSITKS